MPSIEPGSSLKLAAQDLIQAIKNLKKAPIDLNPRYTAALRELATIFEETTVEAEETTSSQSAPRVHNNTQVLRVHEPCTSHNPTSLRVLATQPRIHQQRTRNNTLMPTIHKESNNQCNA